MLPRPSMVWRSCTPFSWMRGAAEPRPLLPHAAHPPGARSCAVGVRQRAFTHVCTLIGAPSDCQLYEGGRPCSIDPHWYAWVGLADTSGTRLSLLCATTWLSWAGCHAKRTWSTCARRCAPQPLPSHTCLPCSSVGIWSDSSHARIGANRHGPCAYTDFLVRYLFA